jgi:hypothetical protein
MKETQPMTTEDAKLTADIIRHFGRSKSDSEFAASYSRSDIFIMVREIVSLIRDFGSVATLDALRGAIKLHETAQRCGYSVKLADVGTYALYRDDVRIMDGLSYDAIHEEVTRIAAIP